MKKINVFIFIILSLSLPAAAQVYSKSGLYAGQFLKIAQSARYAAMADAVTAQAESAPAMGYNPAGTSWGAADELALSYTKYLVDSHMANIHFKHAYTLLDAGIGARFFFHGQNDSVDEFGNNAAGQGMGMNFELTGNLSKKLFNVISIGVNVKYLLERQTSVAVSSGISIDAGTTLRFGVIHKSLEGLGLGFAVQNMGTAGKLKNVSSKLPTTLRSGISYRHSFGGKFDIGGEAGIEKSADSRLKAAVGTEFSLLKAVFVQLGYKIGEKSYGFRWGAGMSISGNSVNYNMEMREIGLVHHIDYVLALGDPKNAIKTGKASEK